MEVLAILFVFFIVILIVSKLFPSHLQLEVEELVKRVGRLEKQLSSHRESSTPLTQPIVEKKTEPPIIPKSDSAAEPAALKETDKDIAALVRDINQPAERTESPVRETVPSTAKVLQHSINADTLERYVGQRVIGWAAVGLAIFAIGFFIKYAYDKGWIIPEGRVAIGELIGLGLIAAGWWQHRKGNSLGSQMLLGCGIAACYLATYAAFGFYDLISQPVAGLFMMVVMFAAGCLAVITNAYSLGMLTVLGGLLTPLMLYTGQDQHVSLFTYLSLLIASIYVLYFWKSWLGLRSLVWIGAMLHFCSWYIGYYAEASRSYCFLFLSLMWLIPAVQILLRGQRHATRDEDWLLFLITPLIIFAIVSALLLPDMESLRGKIAIALTVLYSAISYCTWRWRQHDYHQFQLPLSVGLIFLSVAIPLELAVGWIGVGWLTQGVVLWGAGLWRSDRLVRFFGFAALFMGTLRVFTHDVYLHQAIGWLPFLNVQAIPGLWLSFCWAVAGWLAFHYQDKLQKEQRVWVVLSIAAFWIFWIVLNIEVYPFLKSWQVTTRWIAIAWIVTAIPFFWWGCRLLLVEWRISAIMMIALAVLRSLLNDLPFHREAPFVPLFNQLSLPVLLTAAMLLAFRPILVRFEPVFLPDEKHIKPVSGLTALAMIFLIVSLDTYQFCVVNFPSQQLLPHAVLSVVWSLYGALLLSIGFWKHLATLRWSAIGIFGLTLAKVLIIDLSWLAGLYRILALLFIALVLAAVTWTYQRRK